MPLRNLLLTIAAAVLLALFVVGLSDTSSVVSHTASTTPVAQEAATSASSTASTTSGTASTTAATAKEAPSLPAIPALSQAQIDSQNLTAAGGQLLRSIVNIICLPQNSQTPLRGISGSGVIIDSRGLILTAAHVGQYFLLRDYPKPGSLSCVIRTGGPAADAYLAEPVYVSPSWVTNNPDTLSESTPRGTGEDDFAILAITGSATSASLPTSFPSIPLSVAGDPTVGEKVAIGAYAAQFLATSQIEDALYPAIVFGSISDRFTFDTDTVDVVSVAGTPVAQEGSSGGGLADSSGHLIGLITTSTIAGDSSQRTLHAITPLHIRTSFAADSGANLDSYLSGSSLSDLVANFKSEARTLRSVLVSALQSN